MKKKIFLIPLAMFMTAGTVTLAGCGEQPEPTPVVQTLDSISVTKMPTKTEYNANDPFDPSGLEVTAKYSDGSTKVLAGTDYTLSPTQSLPAGTTKVVVTYEEGGVTKTADIAVTVNNPAPVNVLTGLVVDTQPSKIAYQAGEDFDPTGMVVSAVYSDGSGKILNGTDYTIDPLHNLAAGTDHVTLSYTEGDVTKTVDVVISVTVEPVVKILTNVVIKTAPAVVDYNVGEVFDPTGMVVEAKYSDGSSSEIPGTEYTISPLAALTEADTKVTVSYSEGDVTKTVDVAITVADYGSEANPLSVSDALDLLGVQCEESGDYAKHVMVVQGLIKQIKKRTVQTDYVQYELLISDGSKDLTIFKMNVTSEELDTKIAAGKFIVVKGYGENYNGTLEITYKNNENPSCLSVTDKEVSSLNNIVGPESVALNSSVVLDSVTFDVVYADGTTLADVHPSSIDLDTSEPGEKTATVYFGGASGTFVITVTSEETPNKFIEAYEAAAALKWGDSTTDSYNFKGVVIAKRATEYYVYYEGYGLDVYNPSPAPSIGDLVEVNSTMKNYNGTLETGTINSFVIVDSGKDIPDATEITCADDLAGLKQNVLANISGVAKEDITTIDTSKDYTLKLMVGTDEIPVFIKKASLASLKDKLIGTKAGDPISISAGVTGDFKGTKQVLVVDGSTVSIPRAVTGVEFEEEAYSVLVNETVTVKANVLPSDADDKVVSYSLENASAGVEATIDAETGVITAGSVAGTVDVVATAHGDSTKTASVTLTISSSAIAVTGVSLDKEEMTIEMKGEGPWTGSLTPTVAPSDATNKNCSFSSDNEEVATVTNEGVVTGLKEGECNITVTTEDGGKTAVCHVSVIPEQPIVKAGTYAIKHVRGEVTYYMSASQGSNGQPNATTEASEAAVFDFELKENTIDTYTIKIHGENKYLALGKKDNNGVRYSSSAFEWKITDGTLASGAFNLSGVYSGETRYLALYISGATTDFRCYTAPDASNRKENTDLEAVVAKDVESIAIKQNPTKMTYYVGEAFNPEGMIVTVTYTDKSTEDITEGFTYEGSTGFQTANPDRTVKVTYKTKNAYVQHVEVKEDDRTITAIKFAEGCDMTKKEYKVGDSWDPKGLKVIAVRSDNTEFELADSDVTFTYDKTTEAAAESMILNVTAHYVVDDSTTLDSAAKAITVVVKEKEAPVGGTVTASYPKDKGTTNMTADAEANAEAIGLDSDLFNVVASKNTGSGNLCGLNNAGYMALYCNKNTSDGGSIEFIIDSNYIIESIVISWKQNEQYAKVTDASGSVVTAVNNVYTINGSSFKIQDVANQTSPQQVHIYSIEITYSVKA